MRGLKKRIETLEAKLRIEGITLFMQDGSTRTIRGGDFILSLLQDSGQDEAERRYPREFQWVVNSASSNEDGELIGLIKAIHSGPNETGMPGEPC